MRSTGEVMGVGRTFAEAFAKAQLGSNSTMKKQGRALLSFAKAIKSAWLTGEAAVRFRAGCDPRYGDCAG
jgi:hypothetical protein